MNSADHIYRKLFMRASLFLLWTLISIGALSQSSNPYKVRTQLEGMNAKLKSVWIEKDIQRLMTHYAPHAISMPEYQATLEGAEAIRLYYTEMFNRYPTFTFDKKQQEVFVMEQHVAEIGTFTLTYGQKNAVSKVETGKYFNIWAILPDNSLKIEAESFGYFRHVTNPLDFTIENTSAGQRLIWQASDKTKSIKLELAALNALMEKAVRNRDGSLRSDFFTTDAVFMPFADSSKVGIKNISEHLIQYNSGNVSIDSIAIYNTHYTVDDGYVIEYPRFYVEWHLPEMKGSGTGKGIRIWRREPDCSLRLFREIGLHDHMSN
jgi:ketosteroid isomerase-like protein